MPVKSRDMVIVQYSSWESPMDVFTFAWKSLKPPLLRNFQEWDLDYTKMDHSSDVFFFLTLNPKFPGDRRMRKFSDIDGT